MEFLGFVITTSGVEMDKKKVQTILDWPIPRNVRDVRSFLGFANFYRRFIRGYSAIAHSLTALTRKELRFVWTTKEQESFDALKAAFTSADLLRHFNPDLATTVETDASDYAIAGILSQTNKSGVLQPVAFLSRKLTPPKLNYEIHDKEMLAIVQAFKEWRHYLKGAASQTTVFTDHRSLEYFTTSKQLNRRQARWAELLANFDFVIKYRPGSQGTKPDALTRRADYHPTARGSSLDVDANPQNFRPLLKEGQFLGTSVTMTAFNNIQTLLLDASKADIQFGKLVQSIDQGSLTAGKLRLDDGGLLRHGERYYIPDANDLRLLVTRLCHDNRTAGHPGRRKTLQRLNRHYWWPQMKDFVYSFVDTCEVCNRAKSRRHQPYGTLKSLPVPPYPWSSISMDLIEFLPTSQDFNSILVIVDRLTKQAIFVPTTTGLTAETLASLYLKHVFSKHGLPDTIISDRGSEFTSDFWRAITSALGIELHLSTAFHPKTDGQTERVNQILEQYLRIYGDYSQTDWVDLLPLAEFAYNSTTHSATGVSPFFANKGYNPRAAFEPTGTGDMTTTHNYVANLSDLHAHLRLELQKSLESAAAQYDKHHLPTPAYQVGEQVYLQGKNICTNQPSRKLSQKYLGPFKISEKISSHAYRLALPNDMKIHNVFHVKLLEPYKPNTIPGRYQPPPPPVDVDGEEEWEVETIQQTKLDRRFANPRRYLVKYLGYNEQEWKGIDELENCMPLVEAFNKKHNITL